MPSQRATDLAKAGPTVATMVVVGLALLWAGISVVFGGVLTRGQRSVVSLWRSC